jgi:hypothetical protein
MKAQVFFAPTSKKDLEQYAWEEEQ